LYRLGLPPVTIAWAARNGRVQACLAWLFLVTYASAVAYHIRLV
jgi:hypothetical protein